MISVIWAIGRTPPGGKMAGKRRLSWKMSL